MDRAKVLTRAFKKRVGCASYKSPGRERNHRKPGAIPLALKEKLLKEGTYNSFNRIRELEHQHGRVFGRFSKFNNFYFDGSRVPRFNIPSLEGFNLKPYVSWHTPALPAETLARVGALNDLRAQARAGQL